MLGAHKPKTERMAVLLDPISAASFLGVVAAGLTAEAVLKGRSLFADKMGERVASDVVRLVDDGRALEGPGAEPFDGEGVPTGRTSLIEIGRAERVPPQHLHRDPDGRDVDRQRAAWRVQVDAGRGADEPDPRARNGNAEQLYAKSRPRAARARPDRRALGREPDLRRFLGGRDRRADRGRGRSAAPVREVTIASNVLDILRGIVAVGNDIRYLPFGGAIGTPTILIGEMTVAGT